ncbi:hypothetical protein QUA54_33345 [Microcoleus sp. MOSTC5]
MAKLATSVLPTTQEFLRLESVRRGLTMGQLLDEIVGRYIDVPKTLLN